MTAPHDLDRRLQAFLAEGPTELPDPSFDAVRDRTEGTRQRVVIGPWRMPDMNKLVPIGLGAAAVIVALVVGAQALGSPAPGVGSPAATPSPSPSPTPSPTPTASPTPSGPGSLPFSGDYGDLQAGTYTAMLPVGDTLSMTFTVPAGWSAFASPPGTIIGLVPTFGETAGPGGMAFQFLDVTTLNGDPCHWSGPGDDIPVGPTVDDLVQALQEQTAYEASEPVDVVVGGYAGQRVDIVSPTEPFAGQTNDAPGCDEGVWRFWQDGGGIYAQGPANRWQTNILDVDGTRLVIVVQDFPGTSAAHRAELDAIVDSLAIEP